jgi:hypothetical protein
MASRCRYRHCSSYTDHYHRAVGDRVVDNEKPSAQRVAAAALYRDSPKQGQYRLCGPIARPTKHRQGCASHARPIRQCRGLEGETGGSAQNISSKHFAVLSDYYKNVLLLDEVVTVERAKKDREAAYETSSDTIQKAKLLLQALSERQSEVEALIRAQVYDVTAGDKYAELVQKQELPNPPNSKS